MDTPTLQENQTAPLAQTVKSMISDYLNNLKGNEVSNLHELFLEQVEPPLLEATMESCKFNQVRAAKILGISRGTLRKKLIHYFEDKYCGSKGDA